MLDQDEYSSYQDLIERNRSWAEMQLGSDEGFFKKLSGGQHPPFLFIGCCDSRKPINTITQTGPGELFIHRNIANQVSLTDMNFLSVLEYGVDVLKVKHIIVCGHHGCGGVEAAYKGNSSGLVENWVSPITELARENQSLLNEIKDEQERIDKLSELNVIKQVKNICRSSTMRRCFKSGDYPLLHAWVFKLQSGLITQLDIPVTEWQASGLLPVNYKTEFSRKI